MDQLDGDPQLVPELGDVAGHDEVEVEAARERVRIARPAALSRAPHDGLDPVPVPAVEPGGDFAGDPLGEVPLVGVGAGERSHGDPRAGIATPRLPGGVEPVAAAVHRLDVAAAAPSIFEREPESAHTGREARLGHVLVGPEPIEDLPLGNDPTPGAGQDLEQPALLRREIDGPSGAEQVAVRTQLEGSEAVRLHTASFRSPEAAARNVGQPRRRVPSRRPRARSTARSSIRGAGRIRNPS